MENQFVSYEIAVKLKELGFDEKCLTSYKPEIKKVLSIWLIDEQDIGEEYLVDEGKEMYSKNSTNGGGYIAAPLLQQVIQWLREVHKIDVLPILRSSGKYSYDIYHYDTPNQIGERTRYTCMNSFGNYEKCLEVGLQEALKLIDNDK